MAENKVAERIWVQWYGEGIPEDGIVLDEAVWWFLDKINEHDVCYVTEESAVLAQVRNHAQGYREGFAAAGQAIVKELRGLTGPLERLAGLPRKRNP